MENKYTVTYYGADGSGGSTANPPEIHAKTFRTLAEARQVIKTAMGGRTYGTWRGLAEDGDVEAWHASGDEGCGGYAISRSLTPESTPGG